MQTTTTEILFLSMSSHASAIVLVAIASQSAAVVPTTKSSDPTFRIAKWGCASHMASPGRAKLGSVICPPSLTSEVHFNSDVTDAEFHGHLAGWQGAAVPMCKMVGQAAHESMSNHDTTMHREFSFHPLAFRQTYNKQILATRISFDVLFNQNFNFSRAENTTMCSLSEAKQARGRSLKIRSDSPVRTELAELWPWQHEIVTVVSSRKNGSVFPQPQYLKMSFAWMAVIWSRGRWVHSYKAIHWGL